MTNKMKTYKISDIAKVNSGGTPSTKEKEYWDSNDVFWLSSGEVNNNSIKKTNKFISYKGLKKSSAKMLPKNSILVALAGQGKTRGRVAITDVELSTNQSVGAITITKFEIAFPNYIFFNLRNRYVELRILSGGEFGRGGLTVKQLSNLDINLPSIEEQKRIADVLSKQESIINKTKDLIEQLDKRNTFMQDELLSGRLRIKEEDGQVEFYKNPDDNWQTVLMNNIDYIIPLDWDILSLEHSDCSMGETILKSNILTDGEYPVYSATESDKIFGYINNPKKILEIGDLIISARGTIGYVKIAKQKCTSTQTTIQLKVNEITPIYLSTVLNNKRADFFPISGGAVPQITISQVKSIKISKPKQEKEIFNITNIIEKLNDEKEKYEELLIEEQKKFDFLLEELMSGRLRIEE